MEGIYIAFIALLVFLLICYSANLILSALQLTNRGGYGYNGIISMLKDNPLLLEINKKECQSYISDLEYKRKFAEIKAIFNIIYNSGVIIYNSIRLKPVKKNCIIDIFFHIIIHIGYYGGFVLACMSLNYYNKTDYDSNNFEKCNKLDGTFVITKEIFDEAKMVSKWVIKADKAILSILCIYFTPFFILSFAIIIEIKCDGDGVCIDTDFCWICKCLFICFSSICECCLCCFENIYGCLCSCCKGFGSCCSDCCGSICNGLSSCCRAFGNCCSDCCESICRGLSSCCNNKCDCCDGFGSCCSGCCDKCGNCCAKCCGNDHDSLKQENNALRKKIKDLEKENELLKKQINNEHNNITTERKNYDSEITMIKDKTINIINSPEELSSVERDNLKKKIIIYENEISKLKTDTNNLTNEINYLKNNNINLENKLIINSIEKKQLNIIEYYLKKEKTKDFNNKSSLKIFLLKEINDKYGLYLDSNKFIEISLNYIESKLIEHLTNPKNLKIFSNPVISKEGITYEGENNNQVNDFIENKLVSKICEIVRKNKNNLKMQDFDIIKQLLKSDKTNLFFINPVVVSNGINKGETVEGSDNENINYKNIVIKNIINDIKELLDDNFFKFEGLKLEDMKSFVDFNNIMVINFISGDGNINQGIKCLKTDTFAQVEEQLYKIYDNYRESNNSFLFGGKTVLRFKTIEENKIKDGEKIMMQIFD